MNKSKFKINKQKKMNNKIIIGVVLLLTVMGAFYTGIAYTNYQRSSIRNMGTRNTQFTGVNFNDTQRLGAGMMRVGTGGLTTGEIISKDESGINIKLNNGGSKIIFISEKTLITKSIPATKEDLAVGKQVTISGTPNSEGSLTSESIQIK